MEHQLQLIVDKVPTQRANAQALKVCDRMEAMGFSNFSGLRNKFKGEPQNEFEANQRGLCCMSR
jgi:hypothetical protein